MLRIITVDGEEIQGLAEEYLPYMDRLKLRNKCGVVFIPIDEVRESARI